MSILGKITQLHELNTILSKKSKDYSYFIKINIYKLIIDFIDINGETEFIKYFNKMIISFKSSKYYTIGNELQNSINSFANIDDFIFKIDNIKGGIINNNINDFYNELNIFIIQQFAIYIPSKKISKKVIKDMIEPKNVIEKEKEEEPKKISKKVIEKEKEEEPKKISKKVIEKEKEEEPKKISKKVIKDMIEPKKIIIEEVKKKELTPYNEFFKEQSILLKDNNKITNKMEYIAKLWKEHKEEKEKEEEIKKPVKKHTITSTMKKLVWNMHIGEEIGKAKCVCCKNSYISQMSFHCGHIIAESKGGEMIVSNLRPICQNCNSSMGNKNMEEFMKTLL